VHLKLGASLTAEPTEGAEKPIFHPFPGALSSSRRISKGKAVRYSVLCFRIKMHPQIFKTLISTMSRWRIKDFSNAGIDFASLFFYLNMISPILIFSVKAPSYFK
jgi:hypothetical protein